MMKYKNKLLLGVFLSFLFYGSFVLADNDGIIGVWSSACAKDDQGNYNIETFRFSKNNNAVYSIHTYADAQCQEPLSTLSAYRSYQLGEPVAGMENTRKLDYVFKSITMTYKNPQSVAKANKNKNYGFSDWKLNQPKIVTNLKRDKEADREHAMGDRFFTIVKIEKDRLFVGDYASGTGKSANSRLSKIYEVPFVKQGDDTN